MGNLAGGEIRKLWGIDKVGKLENRKLWENEQMENVKRVENVAGMRNLENTK